MKTPVMMLEDLAGEITESTSLLEMIYRNSPDTGETDSAIACLIRSMLKTIDKANNYIATLNN